MNVTLTFKLTFRSDYHIGAGSGRGSEIDSALLRDSDGAPVIRGTIIAGLLRDSLWRLLQLEPLNEYGSCQYSLVNGELRYCNQCPICQLFGTPTSPKRWHISSARPADLQNPLRKGEQTVETDAQIIQRARINPAIRRAATGQLFAQEIGNSQDFYFEITGSGQGETLLDEVSLLVAIARNVRELGHAKRRGQGSCEIHLTKATPLPNLPDEALEKALLTHFSERWLSGQAKTLVTTNQPLSLSGIIAANDNELTKHFRLVLRLDEPVIIARQSEAGNQFDTLEAISGTALCGALATRIAAHNDLAQEHTFTQFVNLLRRGHIRFSYLYPATHIDNKRIEDLYPAIPTPLDFLTCKAFPDFQKGRHKARGYTGLPINESKHCDHPGCSQDLKQLGGFIRFQSSLKTIDLYKSSEMHIRLNPSLQRVEQGMLFGYTTLTAGQYFTGEIAFSEDAWQTFQQMSAIEINRVFNLRLGKASRRGYGKVSAYLQPCDDENPIWIRRSFDERIASGAPTKILVLTLLTDTIITDLWGRYHLTFEKSWLKETLGIPIDEVNVFTKPRAVDGFYQHLGLQRQRDVALQAGSAVGLHLSSTPTREQLAHLERLEQVGIGLRREEGFGQIVFNHPVYHQQFKNVRGKAIELTDETMKLGHANTTSSRFQKFQEDWDKMLKQVEEANWKEHAPDDLEKLIAVAKWLQSNLHQSLDTLQKQLTDWKNTGFMPEDKLTRLIADYGSPDYIMREPKRMKRTEVLERVVGLIFELQSLLQKYPTVNQAVGLTLLADCIAAEAKLARKGNDR